MVHCFSCIVFYLSNSIEVISFKNYLKNKNVPVVYYLILNVLCLYFGSPTELESIFFIGDYWFQYFSLCNILSVWNWCWQMTTRYKHKWYFLVWQGSVYEVNIFQLCSVFYEIAVFFYFGLALIWNECSPVTWNTTAFDKIVYTAAQLSMWRIDLGITMILILNNMHVSLFFISISRSCRPLLCMYVPS